MVTTENHLYCFSGKRYSLPIRYSASALNKGSQPFGNIQNSAVEQEEA